MVHRGLRNGNAPLIRIEIRRKNVPSMADKNENEP